MREKDTRNSRGGRYLVEQNFDYQWGIVTKTVGIQDIPKGASYPIGKHPQEYIFNTEKGRVLHDFHILYILKGRGWIQTTHSPKSMAKAGDAFIIFPGEWHSYAPDPQTGWTEAWIDFSGEFADKVIREGFFDIDHPLVRVGMSETLCNAFDLAYKIACEELPAHQQQLAGLAYLILSSIYAKNKQRGYRNTPGMDTINLAQKYMRENVSKNMSMEDFAEKVGMGYSKYRKLFRQYTGLSPAQYYLRLKMAKAKDYLSNTDYSIKEIAFMLGFDSSSYFIKIFKQHNNATPREFRSLLREG